MERATKTAIKKLVLDLRHLLEEDIEVVLKRYGLFTNREWLVEERIPRADAELLAARARMAAAVEVEMARGIKRGEATRWYIREVAFTYLNRLVGLKCLEVRGLIDEVITTRMEYGGRSQFHRDFRHDYPQLAAKPDDALPHMLEAACRFVTDEMIGVLFDPDSESSVVWPRYQTLRQVIELINGLRTDVWAEDEIIGWIYQFYNAEEKEKIRDKGRGKFELPVELAVINQFFTPRWVVKYLVDNTLGRLWLEMYPDSARVRAKCDYLVPEPLPVEDEIEKDDNKFAPDPNSPVNNPQAPSRRQAKPVTQIRLIDPACGAMHFGYYAFEVFQEMYQDARERGWPIWSVDYNNRQPILPPPTDAEIPALILGRNLYGVDIDLRAVQLAALALYMKARVAERDADPQHNSQYRVNLVCANARLTDDGLRERFLGRYQDDPKLQQVWRELFSEMEDIAQVGSLLQPEERLRQLLEAYKPPTIQLDTRQQLQLPNVDPKPRQMMLAEAPGGERWSPQRTLSQMVDNLHHFARNALQEADVNAQLFAIEAEKTLSLLDVLLREYDVSVMNPPFGYALPQAKKLIKSLYPEWSDNLLCAFYICSEKLVSKSGYIGMVSDKTFAVKKSYANFRKKFFLDNPSLTSFLDLGWGVLDDANVEVCAFVSNPNSKSFDSSFFDLQAYENKEVYLKKGLSFEEGIFYCTKVDFLKKFPFGAFAYKAPYTVLRAFEKFEKLSDSFAYCPSGGLDAPAGEYYRYHWEVPFELVAQKGKYTPYWNGASGYVPFYLPLEQIFRWDYDGKRAMKDPRSRYSSVDYYFKSGIGWGKRGDVLDVGYLEDAVFSKEGQALFPFNNDHIWPIIGFLNSYFAQFAINLYCGQHKTGAYVGQLPISIKILNSSSSLGKYAYQQYLFRKAWELGNETNPSFNTPWILQLKNRDLSLSKNIIQVFNVNIEIDNDVPSKLLAPNNGLLNDLDILALIEKKLNTIIEQIQSEIEGEIYSQYSISRSDQRYIEQELFSRPKNTIWPQMHDKLQKEKRREHIYRLLSFFILNAIKSVEDGILPFYSGTGHATILQQLRYQMEMEYDAEIAFQMEDDAGKELGRSVESWLDGPFIQWHTKLYKKRPILWQLTSPNNSFAVLLYYHKLDKDILPKIRNVYLRAFRDSLRRQLDAARQANNNKIIDQLETTLDDLAQMDEKLQAVIESGYNPAIDDGVKANILPLQEAGLLRYKVV